MPAAVRFLLFFTVTGVLSVLVHIYLYRRIFRDTSGHPRWRTAGLVAMVALCLLMLGSRLLSWVLPKDAVLALATVGWSWMGVAIYLLLAFWVLGGAQALARLSRRVIPRPFPASASAPTPAPAPAPTPAPAPVSEERRLFLARVTAGGAVLATGSVVGYGTWRAFHPPSVNRVALRLPGLPKALDGFTLVQLSDIHVGPVIQRRFMDAVVEQCNALKPGV